MFGFRITYNYMQYLGKMEEQELTELKLLQSEQQRIAALWRFEATVHITSYENTSVNKEFCEMLVCAHIHTRECENM